MNINQQLWIGLVGVHPHSENSILGSYSGGFTNIVVFAQNKAEFKKEVSKFCLENNLDVFEIEDIERVSKRMKKHKLGTSVLKIIEYVRVTGLPCMSDLHVIWVWWLGQLHKIFAIEAYHMQYSFDKSFPGSKEVKVFKVSISILLEISEMGGDWFILS